ncbi:hypothetical protein CC80DRAFT_530239 [Byssothecium circinans]|uniref:Transcription factor IIIC putative zinc-finger domain-containing protein n=1 Tax=Byssothecium circinans TaxID=147558 RepID=A0A6A5UQJ4_9PLEO|nr:hypothetical protein CC80DRAFT_530239 [Byssothecium circinans]
MSHVTDLRVWPCTFEAIDWSHDGIIALAAEESVELLFPNADINDTEQKDVSWQHMPLPVPWFSTDELPDKEPAPVPSYSIGEEISTSLPISIAWSPPGLAKHRRCALGALTSSLVLSLWSSNGKPHDPASWSRRIIINNALAEYFIPEDDDADGPAAEESVLTSKNVEKARLRTRVRAFAWAHGLPSAESSGIVGTQVKWGQYILAVANDDNQISFVIVESPTSTFGAEDEWTADVLNHFTITPDSESIFLAPGTFDDVMKQQRHVSHIAWSPWTIRGEWYHSVLVYVTNDDVRARLITYKHDTIGLGDEIVYPDINLRCRGPLKWSPKIRDDDKFELALFGHDGLTVLTVSATYATIIDRKEHDLDDRWDDISGAVWDHSDKDRSRLHFSSVTSTMSSPTAAVSLLAEKLAALPSPGWREQISDSQALFSAQNDLKGNVKSKVWGLCGSPLGDFVAACHTVHPSDMLEYGPPRDRHCTIAVNSFKSYSQIAALELPVKNVSAEGITFTVRKWLENTVESSKQMPAFQEQVLEKLMTTYGPISEAHSSDSAMNSYKSDSLAELTAEFKQNVFLHPNTVNDRYTILTNRVCDPTTSNALSKTLIAYRLANATTQLPANFSRASHFSLSILSLHRELIALVNTVINPDQDLSSSIAPISGGVIDTCDFCNAVIPFEDLDVARCKNGHEFPRCGLSFVSIQAPRITKNCTICGMLFLSEEFVDAQEQGSRPSSPGGGNKVSNQQNGSRKMEVETRQSVTGNHPVETTSEQEQQQSKGNEKEKETEVEDIVETTEPHDVEMMDTQGSDGEEHDELLVSLARLLFLSCDACIYCGGKYEG